MLKIHGRSAAFRRFGAPLVMLAVLLAVTGCSGMNPFYSDNSPLPLPPPLEADAEGNVADNTGRKDDAGTDMAVEKDTAKAGDEEYPGLSGVPEGAEATKTAEKSPEAATLREQLAGELVADREKAKYTDEELRGGRVAAVSSPRPQPPAPPPAEGKPEAGAAQEPASIPAPQLPPRAAAPPPQAAAVPLIPPASRSVPVRSAVAPVPTASAYSSSTFQPSTAPPLPADLVASLPAGVAQRYQETLRKPVSGAPSALPVAPVIGGRGAGAFASIPFASGSAQLSSGDRQTITQVASAARNGFGVIRVVGHASSTASSQSESQRMIANWEVSQARATSVADALVGQGVDAARIIIEAVGDSQAATIAGYSDAEAASRRVDLFLE
ncbi:MAG: OmpA family protein [Alphaproteobacteria bacterium]